MHLKEHRVEVHHSGSIADELAPVLPNPGNESPLSASGECPHHCSALLAGFGLGSCCTDWVIGEELPSAFLSARLIGLPCKSRTVISSYVKSAFLFVFVDADTSGGGPPTSLAASFSMSNGLYMLVQVLLHC